MIRLRRVLLLPVLCLAAVSAQAQKPPIAEARLVLERHKTTTGIETLVDSKAQRFGKTSGASYKKTLLKHNTLIEASAKTFLGNSEGLWMLQASAKARTLMDTPPEAREPGAPSYLVTSSASARDRIQINMKPDESAVSNAVIEMEFELSVFDGLRAPDKGKPQNSTAGSYISLGLHGLSSVYSSGTAEDPQLFTAGKRTRHVLQITRNLLPLPPKTHPAFTSQGQLFLTCGMGASTTVPEYFEGEGLARVAVSPGISGVILVDLRILDEDNQPLSPDDVVISSDSGFNYGALMKQEVREFVELLLKKYSSRAFRGRVNWPAAAPDPPVGDPPDPPASDPHAALRSALSFLTLQLRAKPVPGSPGDHTFPFSGHLGVGHRRFALKGFFDTAGQARFGAGQTDVLRLKRKGLPDILLGPLQLDTSSPEGIVTGDITLDGDTESGGVEVHRALYTATHKSPLPCAKTPFHLQGSHTLAFFGGGDTAPDEPGEGFSNPSFPPGAGTGLAKVLKNGTVSLAAVLPDGTAFTASSSLVEGDRVPFAAALHRGSGALAGSFVFDDTATDTDLAGDEVWWHRPAGVKDGRYPDGWPEGKPLAIQGCKLVPVALLNEEKLLLFPSPLHEPGPVRFFFLGAGLPDADDTPGPPVSPWQVDAAIDTKNKITMDTGMPLALKAAAKKATGLIAGSLLPSGGGKRGSFRAVVLPKQARAVGHWTVKGQSEAGAVEIQPAP